MRMLFYKVPIFVLLFLIVLPAFGQGNPGDPLDSSHFPSVDQNSADYPGNIWITDGMVKIQQQAANTPGSVKWALTYAAKNEWAEFQIHEQAGSSSIMLNGVTISDLVNAQTGTHIPASTNIIVYREGYYDVVYVPESSSLDSTGYVPDVLIPAVDPYHGQTTTAFPFTIAANQTQSVWVDILVPASVPSGYYQGTATVTNGGTTFAALPIVLAVWNFSIPSKPTLKNYYGLDTLDMCGGYFGGTDNGYSECHNYPGSTSDDNALELADLDLSYLLADHRLSAGGAIWPENTYCGSSCSWTDFEAKYGPLLNGTSTKTLLPGAAETMVNLSTPGSNANAQNISTEFLVSHPWTQLISYQCDEPGNNSAIWANCASQAAIGDSATPIIPKVVTSNMRLTTTYGSGALGYINWMFVQEVDMNNANCTSSASGCSGGLFGDQRSSYNTWLGGGSGSYSTKWGPYLGMYVGCSNQGVCGNTTTRNTTLFPSTTSYPAFSIEVSSVRNRIDAWMDYLENASGQLYYDVAWCWAPTNAAAGSSSPCWNSSGNPPPVGTADPWNNIYSFGNNGDGTLVYPGTYAKIGTGPSNSWIPIPLPSIRLKLQRDGIQDYEYMNSLMNAGYSIFVSDQLATFITNIYTFNNNPSYLNNARLALGNKLHQLNLQPATRPTAPAGITITVN